MIIAGNSDGSPRDVDLYVSVFTGRLPDESNFDYKSERNGPDHILVSSDDTLFQGKQQLFATGPSRILFIVGVKGNNNQTSYTLMNYGPNLPDDTYFNFLELPLTRQSSATFMPRDASFRLYRFFSYNIKDLQLNISMTEGATA